MNDYRQRITDAVATDCRVHELRLHGPAGCPRCLARTAAVLAVRDEEMDQLRERVETAEAAITRVRTLAERRAAEARAISLEEDPTGRDQLTAVVSTAKILEALDGTPADSATARVEQPPLEPLRLKVGSHGVWQTIRHTGARIRRDAITLLAEHSDADTLILDFTGVLGVTTCWADELVGKLIAKQDDRQILLDGMNNDVTENVELALSRRGLALEGRQA